MSKIKILFQQQQEIMQEEYYMSQQLNIKQKHLKHLTESLMNFKYQKEVLINSYSTYIQDITVTKENIEDVRFAIKAYTDINNSVEILSTEVDELFEKHNLNLNKVLETLEVDSYSVVEIIIGLKNSFGEEKILPLEVELYTLAIQQHSYYI